MSRDTFLLLYGLQLKGGASSELHIILNLSGGGCREGGPPSPSPPSPLPPFRRHTMTTMKMVWWHALFR
ncbi:hypothetical protein M0804_014031 [Polistes exclamans]|nr:hypothetical protein M0804_014035 [Polistes exclamans]KAI4475878.1 hypothetical protein M0804_014031 [Polistes exclamans]